MPRVAVPRLTAAQRRAIAGFALLYPSYNTPEGAEQRCRSASGRFIDYALRHGYATRAELYDTLHPQEIGPGYGREDDHRIDHVGVRWGAVIIDWTARQFRPEAEWPEITPFEDDTAAIARVREFFASVKRVAAKRPAAKRPAGTMPSAATPTPVRRRTAAARATRGRARASG